MKMSESEIKYYAALCRKNGDNRAAVRYEEGLYNTMGAIDIEVIDKLIDEVRRLRDGEN
tara:strand:+ start:385 stop:561 length:177 start_codon:yes stop_codon:yes gene_type:complete